MVFTADVRITSRPVAPNFEADRGEAPDEPAHKAPKFENVSDDAPVERPKIDASAISYSDDDADEDFDDVSSRKPWYRRLWFIIAFILVAVAVAALLVFLPQYTGSPSDPAPASEFAAEATPDVAATVVSLTPEEQADVEYLNSYPVWEVEKLKSDMAKSLIEAIKAGDIDAVVANDYFAVKGRATNTKAILFADLMWRAKGSYSESSNRRVMRGAVKDGVLDLKQFSDNLAKRRPAEKANEQPRPQK